MSTNIRELAEQYNDYIIERRRYYHSCPELSGQEIHTTEACVRIPMRCRWRKRPVCPSPVRIPA